MTFPDKLTELIGMVEKGVVGRRDAGKYLFDHAEAIRDLVVAAEEVINANDTASRIKLIEALAKLEEA